MSATSTDGDRAAAVVLVGPSVATSPELPALLERTLARLRAAVPGPVAVLASDASEALTRAAASAGATVIEDPRPPLRNAGSLRAALDGVEGNPIVVVNGDTEIDIDFAAVLAEHRERRGDCTVCIAQRDDLSGLGYVRVGPEGAIESFERPMPHLPVTGWAHAGVMVIDRAAVALLAPGVRASIEEDLLPALVVAG